MPDAGCTQSFALANIIPADAVVSINAADGAVTFVNSANVEQRVTFDIEVTNSGNTDGSTSLYTIGGFSLVTQAEAPAVSSVEADYNNGDHDSSDKVISDETKRAIMKFSIIMPSVTILFVGMVIALLVYCPKSAPRKTLYVGGPSFGQGKATRRRTKVIQTVGDDAASIESVNQNDVQNYMTTIGGQ